MPRATCRLLPSGAGRIARDMSKTPAKKPAKAASPADAVIEIEGCERCGEAVAAVHLASQRGADRQPHRTADPATSAGAGPGAWHRAADCAAFPERARSGLSWPSLSKALGRTVDPAGLGDPLSRFGQSGCGGGRRHRRCAQSQGDPLDNQGRAGADRNGKHLYAGTGDAYRLHLRLQRLPIPHIPVRNDLACRAIPRCRGCREGMAFLGRISPEKRVDRASPSPRRRRAAEDCRQGRQGRQEYFKAEIEPLNLPGVQYIGEIDDREKTAFLQGARALLFPIDWPEPFGLVMIEAMACGTPVLAFQNGSVREVIDDGVTKLCGQNVEEGILKMGSVLALEPRAGPAPFRRTVYRHAHGQGLRQAVPAHHQLAGRAAGGTDDRSARRRADRYRGHIIEARRVPGNSRLGFRTWMVAKAIPLSVTPPGEARFYSCHQLSTARAGR